MKCNFKHLGTVALGTLVFTLGAASLAAADDVQSIAKPTSDGIRGAEVYTHICQGCHMPEGQGAIGAGRYPKLAGDPALASWQFVATTVITGRNAMPPFGGAITRNRMVVHLTDEQIADVVNYVRTHFGNTYKPAVTAAEVASLHAH